MIRFEYININTGKIITDPELLSIIREKLSVKNKSSKFLKDKNPYISDRIYPITKSGKFDIGLFYTIIKMLNNIGIDIKDIEIDDLLKKNITPKFDIRNDQFEFENLSLEPYSYQKIAVEKMLDYGRGVILVGTGGGKTLIMSLFLSSLFKNLKKTEKTLIIVPSIQLVEQTYKDLIEYGIDETIISKWSGDNEFKNTDIIISGVDILLSANSDLKFIKDIKLLIVDEVHIVKRQNEINKIIKKINSPNRFGFTGTLPEEKIDCWNIFGKIGPIIFKRKSNELIDSNIITPAKINILNINYNRKSHQDLHDILYNPDIEGNFYQKEINYLIENKFRNNLILQISKKTKKNTLIMVDRILHGEILFDLLSKETKKKIYFIQGSVLVDEREKIRNIMESDDDVVCIAISKVFSTGINIKNIHNIIFSTPGKAKVKIIQSIGRGLRLHRHKQKLIIYDISDDVKYSKRHFEKRLLLYNKEKLPYEIREIKEK